MDRDPFGISKLYTEYRDATPEEIKASGIKPYGVKRSGFLKLKRTKVPRKFSAYKTDEFPKGMKPEIETGYERKYAGNPGKKVKQFSRYVGGE